MTTCQGNLQEFEVGILIATLIHGNDLGHQFWIGIKMFYERGKKASTLDRIFLILPLVCDPPTCECERVSL